MNKLYPFFGILFTIIALETQAAPGDYQKLVDALNVSSYQHIQELEVTTQFTAPKEWGKCNLLDKDNAFLVAKDQLQQLWENAESREVPDELFDSAIFGLAQQMKEDQFLVCKKDLADGTVFTLSALNSPLQLLVKMIYE